MGIVINQSLKNTVSTYFGFGIGAVNTLFLYTYFLTDAYYGLVGYLIAVANIMMPLLTFGVHNTLIKFFSSYSSAEEQHRFTAMMFFLPLLTIIPAGLIGVLSYQWIVPLLSEKNELIKEYLWLTYLIAFAMAYFEVFFAWAKANMKSVFGNFLKEVFHRIVIMGMLFMVFFEVLTLVDFIYGIAIMYLVRMLLMGIAAIRVKRPKMRFNMPQNSREILKYSGFIMLSGSIAIILLDIDKFMIGQF
ncbi:MAG: oligosaccharide flippase family protein [Bacteroidota bacterium]